jgi:plasmid stabilization system protein ParE
VKTRFAGPARRQASETDAWWRANRPAAPDLFAQELSEAVEQLSEHPESGQRYADYEGVRQLLLLKSRCYVYYEVDRAAEVVTIVSVWSTLRGRGPDLG